MWINISNNQKKTTRFHDVRSGLIWECWATEKEISDALADKQVRDMTKSQLVKGAFRMLTLKLGQANVPLIVTNHTYDVIGSYVPTKEMGGGSGLKYAASTIIYLSKKKEKDGTEVVGNIIKAKTAKSRLSKENSRSTIRLYYDERGLDKYYGLLELGELGGLWKQVAGRWEIDGKKVYAKSSLCWAREVLYWRGTQKLGWIAQDQFSYGQWHLSPTWRLPELCLAVLWYAAIPVVCTSSLNFSMNCHMKTGTDEWCP